VRIQSLLLIHQCEVACRTSSEVSDKDVSQALHALLALVHACACGKLAISSGNLASKDAYNSVGDCFVGTIKATFDKCLKVGSEDVKLSAQFESSDWAELHNPDNFKEVSVSGAYAIDVPPPGWNTHPARSPFKLGYSLAHKFKNGITALKLTADTYGASLKAKADSSGAVALESAGYGWGMKAIGTEFVVNNEFEFHGKWGADSIYKCELAGWGVTTTVSQPFSPVMPDLEVATNHEVAAGRAISSSVTCGPASSGGVYSDAKITYTDKKLQKGATWEASASQPLTKLRGTKLQMKRTWSF